MSVTIRVLAPASTGEQRCHFLVQWRDSHAVQHGRTFATWQEAAEFDAAIKAGKLPRDAPGRRAAVTFGTVAARWLATKQATKRPSTADLYATELRTHVLPAFASMPLPISPAVTSRNGSTRWRPPGWRRRPSGTPTAQCSSRCSTTPSMTGCWPARRATASNCPLPPCP